MKYIFFATMISLLSMNSFAIGENNESHNACCSQCDIKKGGDGSCLNRRTAEKREATSDKKASSSKKATAVGQ